MESPRHPPRTSRGICARGDGGCWGRARRELAPRYPTYAEFEPVRRKGRQKVATATNARYRRRPPRLLEPDEDGRVSTTALNAEFDSLYLENETNPRWIAKPAVAYLWARTIRCGGCRAEIPLLKTRWLCKKAKKRIRLTLEPRTDGSGVDFGMEHDVPEGRGNAAQKREHDRGFGEGTMSANGARCPSCGAVATTKDIRVAGLARQMGARLTAVVVDGQQGKEYRPPTEAAIEAARVDADALNALYAEIPFGTPNERTPRAGIGASRAFSVDGYGFEGWHSLFTDRQLLALGTFVREIRRTVERMRAAPSYDHDSEAVTSTDDCPDSWREAFAAYLSCAASKFADYSSALCSWHNSGEKLRNTFARFALPMVWDYCEVNPLANTTGGFPASVEWVARVVEHLDAAAAGAPTPTVVLQSATASIAGRFDLICTDPPYYDAIPYSDLMDFFHVWLRRTLHRVSPDIDARLRRPSRAEVERTGERRRTDRRRRPLWLAVTGRRPSETTRTAWRARSVASMKRYGTTVGWLSSLPTSRRMPGRRSCRP